MTLIDELFNQKNIEIALRPIRKENQEKWMKEEKKIKEQVLNKAYMPTIQQYKRHESYDSMARILIRLLKNTILKDCISLHNGKYYSNTEQALNYMLKEANQGKIYYAEIIHKKIIETMLLDDLKEELERYIPNDCILSLLENRIHFVILFVVILILFHLFDELLDFSIFSTLFFSVFQCFLKKLFLVFSFRVH